MLYITAVKHYTISHAYLILIFFSPGLPRAKYALALILSERHDFGSQELRGGRSELVQCSK